MGLAGWKKLPLKSFWRVCRKQNCICISMEHSHQPWCSRWVRGIKSNYLINPLQKLKPPINLPTCKVFLICCIKVLLCLSTSRIIMIWRGIILPNAKKIMLFIPNCHLIHKPTPSGVLLSIQWLAGFCGPWRMRGRSGGSVLNWWWIFCGT